MAFHHNKSALLITVERVSRKIIDGKKPNKGAKAARRRLQLSLAPLASNMRQSITYGNGTEFTQHHLLNQAYRLTFT